MNKEDLVCTIAAKTGLTQVQAIKFLNAFQETVLEAGVKGETVSIRGFVKFEPRDYASRTYFGNISGEGKKSHIKPAHTAVRAVVSTSFNKELTAIKG